MSYIYAPRLETSEFLHAYSDIQPDREQSDWQTIYGQVMHTVLFAYPQKSARYAEGALSFCQHP